MQLKRLDIFFTRSEHWLSKTIRKLTCSKGEAATVANHIGIIGYEGDDLRAWGIEALGTGVKFHRLIDRYSPTDEICVFRATNLTTVEVDAIYLEACKMVNRPYGYGKLILHALDWCIGGKYFFRRIGGLDAFPICSYLVADAFKAAGKDFGVSVGAASPDDIWDFIASNPDKYRFVWQQGEMYVKGKADAGIRAERAS